MRTFIFFALVFLFCGGINAQQPPNWQWLHPTPQGNLLRWVKVIDANTYIAGGNSGTFIKTTDGGATWMTRFDATRTASNGVYGTAQAAHFFDANSGIVCGTYGVTLTNDGGQTFDTTTTVLPSGVTWYGMRFINRTMGFIAGTTSGRMAKTTDGGYTWALNTVLPSATYYDVWPHSDQKIVIVGSYTGNANVRVSTDGGASWSTAAAGTSTLYCVTFADSMTGFAAGSNGLAFKTTNGGLTWSAMATGAPSSVILYSVVVNNGNVFVVGDAGKLYKSTDMGQTFTPVVCADPTQTITGSFLGLGISGQTMVAVGNAGQVNISTDGGLTWNTFLRAAKNGQNYALWTGEGGKMIAVGSQTTGASIPDQIIVSTNAGTSWRSLTSLQSLTSFRGIQMLTRDTGFICGTLGNIYKTTNGGLSWDSLPTNIPTSLTINYVQFLTQRIGWAFSQSGHIWKTTNGGTQWSFVRPDTLTNFLCAHMFDTLSGFVVGTGGGMYRTTDGGASWIPMNSGLTTTLFWIKMLDRQRGFIAASGGILLKTTDGGNTWPSVNIGTQAALYCVDALDANNIAVSGGTGFFFRTSDGGASWRRSVMGGGSLVVVKFLHPDTLLTAGSSGSIIRMILSGGTPVQCTDIRVAAGWNMLSVPRNAPDMTATGLFPLKNSPAFTFLNGYITHDTLKRGAGYWMRFPGSQLARVCGEPFTQTVIPLKSGWNMIGIHHTALPSAGITTNPPNILTSAFFGYSGGYVTSDTLQQGKGYWIRAASDGVMNLSSAGLSKVACAETPQAAGSLIFTDNEGASVTLSFSETPVDEIAAELPPPPPAGVFDARFSDNTGVASLTKENQRIVLRGAAFPVTVRAEGIDVRLSDNIGGKVFSASVESGGQIKLTNSGVTSLLVSAEKNVLSFQLRQNYPNPFNPATTIQYQVVSQQSSANSRMMVSLKVFDVLGREVATLVNEEKSEGSYNVTFNASSLPSGTYFYELRAGEYRAVRKMVLIK